MGLWLDVRNVEADGALGIGKVQPFVRTKLRQIAQHMAACIHAEQIAARQRGAGAEQLQMWPGIVKPLLRRMRPAGLSIWQIERQLIEPRALLR